LVATASLIYQVKAQKYVFCYFFPRVHSPNYATDLNALQLKLRLWAKKVLLMAIMITIYLLGVCIPKNRQRFGRNGEIPAKTKLLNNFYWCEIHQKL